jgi:hypothetical protein
MTTRPRRLRQADAVVRKTREIIQYLAPAKWWIENPRHGLLRTRRVVRDLAFVDLDYCMFEDFGYRKPTRFWLLKEMARDLTNVLCDGRCKSSVQGDKGRRRHRFQLGVRCPHRVSREEAYRIPSGVVEYLCQGTGPQAATEAEGAVRNSQVQEVTIKPWHVKPARFRVGRMQRGGGGCQLLLEVTVEANGECYQAKALIDTGAQTSLCRRDLLPEACFTQSSKPLLFKTVSGEELNGGKNEATITLSFEARTEEGVPVGSQWSSTVTAHDGDIGCDLILGYPWLKVNRLDVQPWRDALQLHDPPRWVLWAQKNSTVQGQGRSTATVVTQQEPQPHPASSTQHPLQQPLSSTATRHQEEEECLWEEEEDVEEQMLALVKKMRMCIPGEVHEAEEDEGASDEEISDNEALQEAARHILQVQGEQVEIRGVVQSDDEHPDPVASKLRQEILDEYAGRVFRERVWPNPPARGTHGKAVLRLKPGAVPVVGRVIHLRGERHDALREMEVECRKDGKLEPGRGP